MKNIGIFGMFLFVGGYLALWNFDVLIGYLLGGFIIYIVFYDEIIQSRHIRPPRQSSRL